MSLLQRGNSVIPLTDPSAGQDPRAVTLPAERTRPLGVLVVDDEESIRCLLGLGMRAHGFAVWLAGDALAAVELFRAHHYAIDVVLLDVRMPGRDGPETLAALQKLDPHIHFCFMSGDTGEYSEENLLDLGAFAVFQKPLRLSELAYQLREIAAPIDFLHAFQERR
jgi:two-component system, OmpR family, response regulator